MPDGQGPARGYLGVTRRPSRREWRGALILFAVGTVALVLMLLFVRPQANLLALGSSAPAISLDAAGGGRVDIPAAAAGRPYIVEFFEAGCQHCQESAGKLCGEAVPVFAIDAAKDSVQTILSFRRQYAPRCGYPMLADPALAAGSAYGVSAVPTVYVVNNGRVAYAGAGLAGVSGLADAVKKVLGG